MKRVLNAVVVGLCDTDTSAYLGGGVAVSFDVDAPAPIGETCRRVTLPLFTREEARELGPMYRNGRVRITIETEPSQDVVIWIVTDGNDPEMCADGEFGVEVNGTPYIYYKSDKPVASASVAYRPVTKREFGETIRRPSGPMPLVNDRPTCCVLATQMDVTIIKSAYPNEFGSRYWMLVNGVKRMPIDFCPFCGARLPEIPAEQP